MPIITTTLIINENQEYASIPLFSTKLTKVHPTTVNYKLLV